MVYFLGDLYFFWRLKSTLSASGIPQDHVFFEFVRSQQMQKSFIYAASSCISLVLLSIIGLIFSHRIAGPIRHLENHLLSAGEGKEPVPLQFREKDFFPELADAFNTHQKSLKR